MDYEILSNDSAKVSGGAGIKAAQTLAKSGIKVVVTGNIGPNAYNTLSAAGIKVFTGAFGTIKEVVDKYKKGNLDETTSANVNSHFGIKRTNLDFRRGKKI
jgi:predicted Fe-Mo cluster-binding NifX family protein